MQPPLRPAVANRSFAFAWFAVELLVILYHPLRELPAVLEALLVVLKARTVQHLDAGLHGLEAHGLKHIVGFLDRSAAPAETAESSGDPVLWTKALQVLQELS